jgi:hypothetical protein
MEITAANSVTYPCTYELSNRCTNDIPYSTKPGTNNISNLEQQQCYPKAGPKEGSQSRRDHRIHCGFDHS